jgi:hypothetical protein
MAVAGLIGRDDASAAGGHASWLVGGIAVVAGQTCASEGAPQSPVGLLRDRQDNRVGLKPVGSQGSSVALLVSVCGVTGHSGDVG